MDNAILLGVESKEIRYAHLKNGLLYDLVIERKKTRQITGNIYRGKVTHILHNIQSAFIDIGEGENGFIHMSDILENTKKFEQMFDMDFDLDYDIQNVDTKQKTPLNIDEIMKIDQPVLAQVVKEPIGTKGARLTSNISIAGRYLVLLPNSPHRGVSRKIEDRAVREKLKKLIRAFEMPHDMGLICRTASKLASRDQLIDEAHELLATWEKIIEKFHQSIKPTLLFQESDIISRSILTAIDKKFDRILIDDYSIFQTVKGKVKKYTEEHPLSIEYYRDTVPMFERFNVEKEIEKAMRPKVWLASGGYLIFEQTEAMCTIDVNSGRSGTTGKTGVEETLVKTNLEAVAEIARQLRIRNIGGLVICDFIDMRYRKNQRKVLDCLREAMKEDGAKCTILGMSEFGLIEMTRQRSRESLSQTLFEACPYCHGSGRVKTPESMVIEIERALKKVIRHRQITEVILVTHTSLNDYMNTVDKDFLTRLAKKFKASIEFETSDLLHLNDFKFYQATTHQLIEV
ncbi:MAG: ribonuclease E/G [Chlamydiia bacterium]|nr:ribonuclease E/G [Chlamydiia bacterium]